MEEEKSDDSSMVFGNIALAYKEDKYWIEKSDGEAMEVGEKEMEMLLNSYYNGHF